MDIAIRSDLVGYRVAVETNTINIEGEVVSIDGLKSKLTLTDVKSVCETGDFPTFVQVFAKEIVNIRTLERGQVNCELVTALSAKSKSLVPKKSNLPSHLKSIQHTYDPDILVNKVANPKQTNCEFKIPDYTLINRIDESYYEAVEKILNEKSVGIGMEGVRISRSGFVCWISVALPNHVYLFDMCWLGKPGLKTGLEKLFLNSSILKVVHDCRFMADALVHQYGIQMANVFDTQVAASAIEFQETGLFSRYVMALPNCLTEFLELPSEALFHPRIREGHEQEDESRWIQRPLPQHLINGAILNVCHLLNLRSALTNRLLSMVSRGTDLYLNEVSPLPDDEVPGKLVEAHLIPTKFASLVPKTNLKEKELFSNKVAPSCDPYTNFTRHINVINPKPQN